MGTVIMLEILRPFQVVSRSSLDYVSHVWQSYVALRKANEENEDLRKRIQVLEAENTELREYATENKRLSSLLGYVNEHRLKGIWARVIGYDPSVWQEAITVNRGTKDGISIGMPVVERSGVVGQIISVSQNAATILLVTDNTSGVDAIIQESRSRGVVKGRGKHQCSLEYVVRDQPVKVGDKVITSGMDQVYPKGLLIGIVSGQSTEARGLFHRLELSPSVRFPLLEDVFVIFGAEGGENAKTEEGENDSDRNIEKSK